MPCGPIYSIDQMFDDAQVKHLGLAQDVPNDQNRKITLVNVDALWENAGGKMPAPEYLRAVPTGPLVPVVVAVTIVAGQALPQQSLRDINQAMTRGRPEVIAVGNDNRTAVDRGELDRLVIREQPLDVLAQQIIAEDTMPRYPRIVLKQGTVEMESGSGSYDFGSVQVGTSLVVEFIIENPGHRRGQGGASQ